MQHSLPQCAICYLLLHFFWPGFLGTTHNTDCLGQTDTQTQYIDNALTCRLEKVSLQKLHSMAKVMGTVITVVGAIVLTLVRGPSLCLPWANEEHIDHHQSVQCHSDQTDLVKGALFITAACFCWSWFVILQVRLVSQMTALFSFYYCSIWF